MYTLEARKVTDEAVIFSLRTAKRVRQLFKSEAALSGMGHGAFLEHLVVEYKKMMAANRPNIWRSAFDCRPENRDQ